MTELERLTEFHEACSHDIAQMRQWAMDIVRTDVSFKAKPNTWWDKALHRVAAVKSTRSYDSLLDPNNSIAMSETIDNPKIQQVFLLTVADEMIEKPAVQIEYKIKFPSWDQLESFLYMDLPRATDNANKVKVSIVTEPLVIFPYIKFAAMKDFAPIIDLVKSSLQTLHTYRMNL